MLSLSSMQMQHILYIYILSHIYTYRNESLYYTRALSAEIYIYSKAL